MAPRSFRSTPFLLACLLATWACGAPRSPSPALGEGPQEAPDADPQAPTRGLNAPRWYDAPYVVLVSLDGFGASYMERYRPPHLRGLAAAGAWASAGMISAYPAKTFPNHYTLATGLYPARHGIVANRFWDPEREAYYRISDRQAVEDGTWYGGEPLWVTAERQGMVTASFFWVGSEADVGGARPSHWRRFDDTVTGRTQVDQVLAWLALPTERRPHLVLLYFAETDYAGHDHGPDSPETAAAVARVDGLIGRLRMGLTALPHGDRVNLVVVSDHGIDGFQPDGFRYVEDVTDIADLRMPERGPGGNLWIGGGPERVADVRRRIDEGLAGVRAYPPDEVPERFHYRHHPRLGDLVLVTDSAVMVDLARPPVPARAGFTHGWDPGLGSMRALFVASGPGLERGVVVDPFDNVHVYPLVAALLGLEPARGIDGDLDVWRGVLRGR
jgi:predicted AlkP superfamily pyrophosphatase or phosphodiesterase